MQRWSRLLSDFNLKFSLQKWRRVTTNRFSQSQRLRLIFPCVDEKHASVLQSVESVLQHEDAHRASYMSCFFFSVEKTWFFCLFVFSNTNKHQIQKSSWTGTKLRYDHHVSSASLSFVIFFFFFCHYGKELPELTHRWTFTFLNIYIRKMTTKGK